jgi:hypothetical protein
MDVLRAQLDLDKRAVVEDNLVLSEAAAAAFWPIYEDYQRELRAIDEQVVRLVNEYVKAYVTAPSRTRWPSGCSTSPWL